MDMKTYIVRRLFVGFLTLLGVITIVFLVIRLVPGDPVQVLLGDFYNPETAAKLEAQLNLDKPVLVQYFSYLFDVLRGDFGESYITGKPVFQQLWRAFPYTAHLAVGSLLFSLSIGVPTGVIAAINRNSWIDMVSMSIAIAFISVPGFYLAILLIQFFSLKLGWFPVTGVGNPGDWMSMLRHLVLPSIALGAPTAAITARMTRSSVLDVLSEDYIRTARAKGLAERVVIFKHALRNAMVPIMAIVGLSVAVRFGGSVIIEIVFARTGIGWLLIASIFDRDYIQVQLSVVFYACILVLVNILIDLSYAWLDPRIRYS
jgi:peptide/nickel transport system permease protein/oligopeptide transport system permease protein